ncbi:phosphate/phosphite/phosphonate ABC transporter substrate-binding protein [Vibrio sp. ZSDE26]|uniref:Phosphate/phosphite/phosphonate ABC transporter substrate-binding protein n=1 Tax=Vibrio amylolyticus TaxID=2847292 RepID=A0A9X2BJ82_9VIBR|nr:phosphate/phosphite/phosphonate ABC transporter substrate-binding protein [Vibrio amylolyticus]MCK6264950.1 phosphate/phosphite/phosphonate ABC transporter substrate-binding protein [Vibrio amylolyticus]
MKKILYTFLISFAAPLLAADPITFAIVPQQSASRLAAQWSPIIQYLSQETGRDFIFSTAKDIPMFEQRLSNGEYDFAYMNPYHYVTFSHSPGYRSISKAKDKKIKGIIVARKDSNITDLMELDGSTLAFPAPAAFAASVLTRSVLKQKGVSFEPDYVSSHDSVYLSVAKGFYPAGGGIIRTFNSIDPELREQLVPIYTTKGYTPHAIAHHPRVDAKLAAQVQELLAALHTSEQGRALLKPLNIKSFVDGANSDWDDVRALNIKEIKQ